MNVKGMRNNGSQQTKKEIGTRLGLVEHHTNTIPLCGLCQLINSRPNNSFVGLITYLTAKLAHTCAINVSDTDASFLIPFFSHFSFSPLIPFLIFCVHTILRSQLVPSLLDLMVIPLDFYVL